MLLLLCLLEHDGVAMTAGRTNHILIYESFHSIFFRFDVLLLIAEAC